MRELLRASCRQPMDALGLFVFSTCAQFLRVIPALPRDRLDPEDIDSGAEDHIWDETRYELLYKPATIEMKKVRS